MDPLKGNVVKVFIHYALPSIIGMLALSSSGIIDGIFVGNYVGSSALAAVNLSIPVIAFIMGLAMMFAIGGSVTIGKFLGENNDEQASSVFTAMLIAMGIISVAIAILGHIFIDPLLTLLGSNAELMPLARDYIQIIIQFIPAYMFGIVLVYIVRIDGWPTLAGAAYVVCALVNIVLDWYFITQLDLGLKGAAWATIIAQFALIVVIAPYFFSSKRRLKLKLRPGATSHVWRSVVNGSSDFANEASAGITALVFNWVMMSRFGVDGVAAFAVVNYILFTGLIICFAVSDAMQPLISTCYGANDFKRINAFLKVGSGFIFLIGLSIIAVLLSVPEMMVSLFIDSSSLETSKVANEFIDYFWPAFLFNGLNICVAAYFTAMHKPLPSGVIAVSRSLLFPVICLIVLPMFWQHQGVFAAIPLAELITFVIALWLFKQNSPKSIIDKEKIAQ